MTTYLEEAEPDVPIAAVREYRLMVEYRGTWRRWHPYPVSWEGLLEEVRDFHSLVRQSRPAARVEVKIGATWWIPRPIGSPPRPSDAATKSYVDQVSCALLSANHDYTVKVP